jgi:hypothetical protein
MVRTAGQIAVGFLASAKSITDSNDSIACLEGFGGAFRLYILGFILLDTLMVGEIRMLCQRFLTLLPARLRGELADVVARLCT